jgi:hypothetical protein
VFQADAVRVVHNDKLFKNNPDLEIFEKEYTEKNIDPTVIGSSEKCIDQVKQPCHTVEAVKLIEHELKSKLEGLVKTLFGKKIKYKWVRTVCFTQLTLTNGFLIVGRCVLPIHVSIVGARNLPQRQMD